MKYNDAITSTMGSRWPDPLQVAAANVCGRTKLPGNRETARLLADAEAGENASKQVVAGDLAGDFTQGALRQAQFLGQQFTGV